MQNTTLSNLKPADLLTPDLFACVRAYLLARTYAECERERVDKIHAQILRECPIEADQFEKRGPITSAGKLYLSSNEEACKDFYREADRRLRAAGIKPDAMPRDHCPALVAESLQRDAEHLLVDTAAPVFGLTRDKLLNAGMDTYRKFLDLVVSAAVVSPQFEAPTL